jgi:hypothetical protein
MMPTLSSRAGDVDGVPSALGDADRDLHAVVDVELGEDPPDVAFTVGTDRCSEKAISELVRPRATSTTTARS